ncbi:MAG: MaoC family dehydratase [Rubrivivax sp.]|nr:MaoC family dehydratase [Rubrivivax sp.]
MKTCHARLMDLAALVEAEIGVSDWIEIDQARIDAFARATGDAQWIHVDPQRAATGPFGSTIAHGFLTLSLIPALKDAAFEVADVRMGINYGLNRVRFIEPVKVGSRLRARFRLLSFEPLEGGAQLGTEAILELGGSVRPACVAHTVSRLFT